MAPELVLIVSYLGFGTFVSVSCARRGINRMAIRHERLLGRLPRREAATPVAAARRQLRTVR